VTAPARHIELSRTLEDGMIAYPGLPGPVICDFLSREASRVLYAKGAELQIGRIELVSNTGTYVDVPFHRFADGEDFAAVDIERLADLDAIVVEARTRASWTRAGWRRSTSRAGRCRRGSSAWARSRYAPSRASARSRSG
jgi:kynurenine formamidase